MRQRGGRRPGRGGYESMTVKDMMDCTEDQAKKSRLKSLVCSVVGLVIFLAVAACGLYCLITVKAETELDREKAGHSYFQTKICPRTWDGNGIFIFVGVTGALACSWAIFSSCLKKQ